MIQKTEAFLLFSLVKGSLLLPDFQGDISHSDSRERAKHTKWWIVWKCHSASYTVELHVNVSSQKEKLDCTNSPGSNEGDVVTLCRFSVNFHELYMNEHEAISFTSSKSGFSWSCCRFRLWPPEETTWGQFGCAEFQRRRQNKSLPILFVIFSTSSFLRQSSQNSV